MSKYQKIKSVWKRQTQKPCPMIYNEWATDTIAMLKNCDWIFTEKIDGTNIRVIWDGHQISFKGRNEKSSIPETITALLTEMFQGEEMEQLFEQTFGEKEVIIYGEGYGGNIQKAGPLYGDYSFIVFDIKIDGKYLEWYVAEQLAIDLGLTTTPVVLKGALDEGIEAVVEGFPSFVADSPLEAQGLVGRLEHTVYDSKGERVTVKLVGKHLRKAVDDV